jgi:hypothetical protein
MSITRKDFFKMVHKHKCDLNLVLSPFQKKKKIHHFLDTDVPIAKTCLYISVSRQNWEAFLETDGV